MSIHEQQSTPTRLFLLSLMLVLLTMLSCFAHAAVSEEQIIFNGPFFENYGQGFTHWAGDTAPPSGTLLLKGSLSALPDVVTPGEEVEFVLNLNVSAMSIAGKDGAVLKNTQDRIWSLDTGKLLGERVNFTVIPDSELLGIGIGSSVPDLILRSTKRAITVPIPQNVQPGTYAIRAFIAGTDMRTGPVNITILNGSPISRDEVSNVSPEITPTQTHTPEPSIEEAGLDPQFAGMSKKIVNEREIHVTSIYPYSGGAGNTIGIKIYGDHFTSPVYVTLVKDNVAIDAYNYCFLENQKYGVVMIDIPPDAEQGLWNLVITTKTGKAVVPFEVTGKMVEPVITSVDAPIVTPDKAVDITITGREFMGPCEILLAGDRISWFSFYPKPVVTHNTIKIRVQIDGPLADDVKPGKLDLAVWNSDGVASVYKKAIAFSIE